MSLLNALEFCCITHNDVNNNTSCVGGSLFTSNMSDVNVVYFYYLFADASTAIRFHKHWEGGAIHFNLPNFTISTVCIDEQVETNKYKFKMHFYLSTN